MESSVCGGAAGGGRAVGLLAGEIKKRHSLRFLIPPAKILNFCYPLLPPLSVSTNSGEKKGIAQALAVRQTERLELTYLSDHLMLQRGFAIAF